MIEATLLPASSSEGDTINRPLISRHTNSGQIPIIPKNSLPNASRQPCRVSYLLEYCPNLETITFTLSLKEIPAHLNSLSSPLDEKEVLSLLTVTSEYITFFDIFVRFPTPVDTRSMRESWMESDLSLRFHKKYEPSSIRPSRALRSTEIDSTRFWNLSWLTNATDIACFHCKKSITLDNIENKFTSPINKKLFKEALLLPASHWQELVECWACHEQSIVMPHLQASATFKKEVCGVGPSYLVISKDMASRWRLRSYPEVLNNRIQCEHCCTELGELSYRGEVQVWKLYKTMLLVFIGDLVWNSFKATHSCLAAELLELHHPFACLPSAIESGQHLYLWVLNWNTTVKTSESASPQSVKLLYRLTSHLEPNLPTLLYFDPQSLFDSLQVLNSQLPVTRRNIKIKDVQWRVAYLMV